MSIKILIVDDHPMLRNGLRDLLARRPEFAVVGEAATGSEAIQLVQERAPDLVIMDVKLPGMTGLEAARMILEKSPSVKVMSFSSDCSRATVDEALELGICGYLTKNSAMSELIEAATAVMGGRLYLSPEVSAGILEDYKKNLLSGTTHKPVYSERELKLLRFVAEGSRSKEIAAKLAVSLKSVETSRARLMKKLGCSNSAELVRYAIREGIVNA